MRTKNLAGFLLPLLAAALSAIAPKAALAQAPRDSAPHARVFLLDERYMESARLRLRSGDTNLAPALMSLRREADRALALSMPTLVSKEVTPPSGDKHDYMSMAPYFWPNPNTPNGLPYIRRDGERNPDIAKIPDHRLLDQMSGRVETLALAYYFTSDEVYAARADELLRAWFLTPATHMNPNLQFAQAVGGVNTGRGTGLIESRSLTRVVDAIGLLEHSRAWTGSDERGLHRWFAKFLDWMQDSANGRDERAAKNNHGTFYDVQAVSFALFLGKDRLAREILEQARQKRIALQIEPDGRQPLELVRTRAWSYSVGNLSGLMLLATLGDPAGVDLWNYQTPDGRSIPRALDYLVPFSLNEKKWSYPEIGEWSPQMLHPLIRLAAVKYPRRQYEALLTRIPAVPPENRTQLLDPKPRGSSADPANE